jgi:DEAD/DEAH box helicase domain-containing protein
MGISVGCAFDCRSGDYKVYLDDNIKYLTDDLNAADLIVGFNIKAFDIPLLNTIAPVENTHIYDLFEQSKLSIGLPRPPGTRLDDHLVAMFGNRFVKTESGAHAPLMYQSQQHGRLISYCLADVRREKMVFDHVWKYKNLTTPRYGLRTVADPRIFMR